MPNSPEIPAFSPTSVPLADIFCTEAYFRNLATLSQLNGREQGCFEEGGEGLTAGDCGCMTPALSTEGRLRRAHLQRAGAGPSEHSPVSALARALLASAQGSSQRKDAPLASSPLRRGRNEAALLLDGPGCCPRPCKDCACAASFGMLFFFHSHVPMS